MRFAINNLVSKETETETETETEAETQNLDHTTHSIVREVSPGPFPERAGGPWEPARASCLGSRMGVSREALDTDEREEETAREREIY